ncbi:MAG: hypothetical protein R3B82_18145 [Sandaracinaceae bacterium]
MRWVCVLAALVGCVACGETTRVDVRVEAEPAALEGASSLRLVIQGLDGSTRLDDTRSLASLSLPTGARVVPRGDGEGFVATATLVDAAGLPLQSERRIARFVAGESRELWLRFDAACRGVTCGERETCRAGACVGACATPTLPGGPHPTPSDVCDPGVDGGVADAGADGGDTDAGPLDASLPDAGPPDAGPHVPSYLVERVASYSTTSAVPEVVAGLSAGGDDRDWLVVVTAAINSRGFTSSQPRVHVRVDGAVLATLGSGTQRDGFDTTQGGPIAYFHRLPASPDPARVEVTLVAQGTPTPEARLSDLVLLAFPLPSGAVAAAARPDDYAVPTGGGFQEAARFEVPAGDHLVLLAYTATPADAPGYALQTRIEAAGEIWPEDSDRFPPFMNSWPLPQPFLVARRVSRSSPSTVRLLAAAGDGVGNEVGDIEMLALDLTAFASYDTQTSFPVVIYGSSTPLQRAACAVDPAGETRDFVVLESMTLGSWGRSGGTLSPFEGTAHARPSAGQRAENPPGAPPSRTPSRPTRASPPRRSAPDGMTDVESKEVVIHDPRAALALARTGGRRPPRRRGPRERVSVGEVDRARYRRPRRRARSLR